MKQVVDFRGVSIPASGSGYGFRSQSRLRDHRHTELKWDSFLGHDPQQQRKPVPDFLHPLSTWTNDARG